MREIKFRGKSVDGFWVSGSLLQREIAEKLISMICTAAIVDNKFIVKNETIGQYTGLHDCEGREIYEGDIVESMNGFGVVEYVLDGFIVTWRKPKALEMFNARLFAIACDNAECHVVGNVHDSPELVEERR